MQTDVKWCFLCLVSKVMLSGELGEHEDACTFREIKCRRNCGLMIAYVDRKKHDCVQALQKCISGTCYVSSITWSRHGLRHAMSSIYNII